MSEINYICAAIIFLLTLGAVVAGVSWCFWKDYTEGPGAAEKTLNEMFGIHKWDDNSKK